jgi:hypothetical protein
MVKKCRKEYKDGLNNRIQHPFPFSIYKLRERVSIWNSFTRTINEIKDYKNGLTNPYMFDGCAPYETSIWLKWRPTEISYRMGYDVVPAIDALKGDGVDQNTIERIKRKFIPEIEELIDDCDALYDVIKKNIYYEYDNFKKGYSELRDLHDRAIDITQGILDYSGREEALYGVYDKIKNEALT